MSVFDRQITLNHRIKVIDDEIIICAISMKMHQESGNDYHYTQAREMWSFWHSRRRWMLARLLKIQLKEFNRG